MYTVIYHDPVYSCYIPGRNCSVSLYIWWPPVSLLPSSYLVTYFKIKIQLMKRQILRGGGGDDRMQIRWIGMIDLLVINRKHFVLVGNWQKSTRALVSRPPHPLYMYIEKGSECWQIKPNRPDGNRPSLNSSKQTWLPVKSNYLLPIYIHVSGHIVWFVHITHFSR